MRSESHLPGPGQSEPPPPLAVLAMPARAARSGVKADLEELGLEVICADDANGALEHLVERECALLLVALELPPTDGLEVIRLASADRTTAHVPRILLAPRRELESVQHRAYLEGAVGCVGLPSRAGILRAKVRGHLALYRAWQRERVRVTALERRSAEHDTFVHAAAHDLRAPLRTARGFLELIGEEVDATTRGDHLVRVTALLGRLDRMLEDTLELASIGSGGSAMDEAVDLETLLESVLEDLGPAIAQSDAQVETGPLPVVRGSAAQLGRVFQNLIANAIKYRGVDRSPRIVVRARVDGPSVRVEVQDNGVGFDMAQRDEIFRPFRRLQQTAESDGSGIGLATVKRIVEAHGGEVDARSAPGEGSTFVIRLPIARFEAGRLEHRRHSSAPDLEHPVLIVDDSPDDLALATRAVGGEIIAARSESEALELLDRPLAGVLSDYHLGTGDGLRLLAAVRRRAPSLRRYLMTASRDAACGRALEEGLAHRVIDKPVRELDVRGLR